MGVLAALIALVVVLPFQPTAKPGLAHYTFEFEAASSVEAVAQLFYDVGGGFNEGESASVPLSVGTNAQLYRLPITSGHYRAFRFDPLNRPGQITLSHLVIRDGDGKVVHRFEPNALRPQNHIASLRVDGPHIHLDTGPNGYDPDVLVVVPPGFRLSDNVPWRWSSYLGSAAVVFLLLLALMAGGIRLARRPPAWWGRVRRYFDARPAQLLALVALVSVTLSAYPVVFAGRSFVTPNYGSILLYEAWPTLPGSTDTGSAHVGASDVGAIMWQHVPYSMLQHRALFRDFELPLWNRYNSGGLPLLGQGQSSFGDPLHFLPILFQGAAWAWDLKYLLAKTLFAFGLGLLVWETARHRPAALLIAATTPFIGFFLFRINHPAFFSLCYGPWILYFGWRIARATDRRQLGLAALGLVLANVAELTSGTVKEAYMLLASLNFAGALLILAQPAPWPLVGRRLATFVAAGLAFVGLTAPVWLTFLDTLGVAYTSYHAPSAFQLPPGLLLAVFDEIFQRPFQHREHVYNGSLNALLLLGLAWLVIRFRTLSGDRVVLALVLASLGPALLALGVVPPQWIIRVPFLRNVAHIDNSFLCVLFVLWSVLAGYGFREAWQRLGTPAGRGDLVLVGLFVAGLGGLYLGTMQAVQRSHRSFLFWGEAFPISSFTGWYALALITGGALWLGALHQWRRHGASPARFTLLAFGLVLLLWRFGWHAGAGWPDFIVSARERPDLGAASAAVDAAQAEHPDPFRAVGFGGNLFPGWTAALELETISGPDALMSPFYRELTEAAGLQRIWDWRIVVTHDTYAELRPVYDFLGVRHLFDIHSGQPVLQQLELVHRADLEVHRSPTAWPRAFFTDSVAEYESPGEFGRLVREGDGRPFAAMVGQDRRISAAAALRRPFEERTVQPARAYRLTHNRTAFTVDAPRAGLVVLQETYWPRGFKALVNGRPSPVLRVNHAFKGVLVPAAGTYEVEFRYRPPRFSLALALAAVGLVLVAGFAFLAWRRNPMRPAPGVPA